MICPCKIWNILVAESGGGEIFGFFLTTDEHFKHFEDSVANELANAKWLGRNENPDEDLEEDYSDEDE